MTHYMIDVKRYSRKLTEGIELVTSVYDKASIVREATNHRPFIDGLDDPKGFGQIGLRHLVPKNWFDKDSNVFPDISDMARSVAIGEEKFLFQKIKDSYSGTAERVAEISPDALNRALSRMIEGGHSPSVAFAPIELYVNMHSWINLMTGRPFVTHPAGPDSYLTIEHVVMRVFWSNKYNPLDRVILYDKAFGEWIVKPDPLTKSYLSVDVRDSEDSSEKLYLRVRTVAKFSISDATRAFMIIPEELPKLS